jgi:branched-chain amino acid transport system permease protein
MTDAQVLIENVLNALAAGIIIGGMYGLMCVGLGLIFSIMKVINFAQGELLMLGMYVTVFIFGGLGLGSLLGPYVGPFVAALLAGPVMFAGGALLHRGLISRVSGLSTVAYPLAILYVLQYLGYQEVSLPMKRDFLTFYLQFSDPRWYTVLALALAVLATLLSMVVENSRFGLALTAIRQNELATESAGIDTLRWKMRALVLSGAVAAAAGGLYACVLLVVTPDAVFGVLVSAQALVVTLFGGVGTIWGPLIGAAMLIPLAETLNAELGNIIPGIQGVVYGGAIIGIMLVAPEGLFWTVRDRWFARGTSAPLPVAMASPVVPVVAAAGGMLLEVRNLSRAFGGLRAIDKISFSVDAGSILGIIGPNGAGKTTLFNVLNGVLTADAGEALLDGRSMAGRSVHAVCRMGVGRTFQVVRSFARLPLFDNVVVGAYGAGLGDAAAIAATQGALAQVGLADIAHRPAGQLTHKELRLMELARAIAGAPRLLLLDETLAGLGREECDAMLDVLARLRAQGMIIVIIEHTMHAMMRIADRFLVLDHGRVLASGAPRDVVENPAVIEAYLGRKWLQRCST